MFRACGTQYLQRYRAMLGQPFALVLGQLLSFFLISLYVKFIEIRLTPDYGAAGGGAGLFGWHYLLFTGQEVMLFAVFLAAMALVRRYAPDANGVWRALAWSLGFVVLPFLSLVEVLGLGHFAMFLTPIGPEEVRLVGWTRHLVSAGNVLQSPGVASGLVLIVAGYHCAPLMLWLGRGRLTALAAPLPVGVALALALFAAVGPKPRVADALLTPHPIVWLVSGGRTERVWDNDLSVATPPRLLGSGRRLAVTNHPRNVLILVLESTRAASVAFYNQGAAAGREFLPLRDEMVVFDQLYAPVPTSAHALFSILYGIYPYLGPFWMGADKTVIADSMAQLYSRAGYRTHFYMTADLDFDNVRSFAARGFDRVLDLHDWPGQESYTLLEWGRDDRLLIEELKVELARDRTQPSFILAFTSNPHHPYPVEQLLRGPPAATPQEAYERLVAYDLRLVAELYEWMKAHGVADDTLLLVLGDHGEAFGEHPGNYGHAAFLYEENLHIPAFILHPRRLGLPRHIAQLGSQVDLRATIADIVGMTDAQPGDGESLLRADAHRTIAHFTENGVSHFGVRDGRYSYIYTPHLGAEQLFDRRRDQGEAHDLGARFPTTAARYRARLRQWETQHQLSLARVLR